MSTPIENAPQVSPTLEEERMKNILLLLENMFEREDPTVKLVLAYLYEVGSVRLIDKNIHIGFLNRSLKSVARISTPIFKVAGLYWFQRNCPKLIVDWLYSQVIFEDKILIEHSQLEPQKVELNKKENEIKRLRTQGRFLATVSAGAIAAVGWLGYQLYTERSPIEATNVRSASGQPCLVKKALD
ncbi:MAG: hypothetical protein WBB29_09290 [Geitlerinemataceae cyanobacterium]